MKIRPFAYPLICVMLLELASHLDGAVKSLRFQIPTGPLAQSIRVAIPMVSAMVGLICVNSVFVLFESLEDDRGGKPHNRFKTYASGFGFWLLYFFASAPASFFTWKIAENLHLRPLVQPEWFGPVKILHMIFYIFVFDFFYYWFHRASHMSLTLWRFHSVHHALRKVNSWNSFHHWTEEYLRIFFVSVPTAAIVEPSADSIPFVSAMLSAWGQYLHTSARSLSLPGSIRRFVADNVYHHYHHSIYREHYNTNYAAFFPFWDWLFRSQYVPPDNSLPPTGIEDVQDIKGPLGYVLRPFKMRQT